MFDEILQAVKDHLADNPQVAALPADQQEALHNEIAQHVANQAGEGGAGGGLLGALGGGSALTSALDGGVNSLAEKFGLSPEVSGAITSALPGLLQKFTSQ
ncbi:hypothetical protein [Dinghuibacter silviterrae]|uniref:Uncharacterized protein n=1 Tax=Dinghuibacter silviterrae TaxID=1539049 RepID=A0A4R8DUY9_9BACT|nr:hypothetical protein [Dinghuibacter silviterrae]TDX02222.1 hypothetical protein EDB95_3275 [Dinghuibacter silviterrae]